MVKLVALYGHPTDPAAFEEYYANTHLPLVEKVAVPRTEATRIVGTPDGSPPANYRVFEMWFENMEQLQRALGSPEGQAATGDLPNFATGGVTILIGEVA
jgi:uncharacterized protein (TIGR02118 family)